MELSCFGKPESDLLRGGYTGFVSRVLMRTTRRRRSADDRGGELSPRPNADGWTAPLNANTRQMATKRKMVECIHCSRVFSTTSDVAQDAPGGDKDHLYIMTSTALQVSAR